VSTVIAIDACPSCFFTYTIASSSRTVQPWTCTRSGSTTPEARRRTGCSGWVADNRTVGNAAERPAGLWAVR
jgi:hypothetical protein